MYKRFVKFAPEWHRSTLSYWSFDETTSGCKRSFDCQTRWFVNALCHQTPHCSISFWKFFLPFSRCLSLSVLFYSSFIALSRLKPWSIRTLNTSSSWVQRRSASETSAKKCKTCTDTFLSSLTKQFVIYLRPFDQFYWMLKCVRSKSSSADHSCDY